MSKGLRLKDLTERKTLIRISGLVGFALLIALILPKDYYLGIQYELNKPWVEEDLKAPFDFPKFKPVEQYEAEQAAALKEVRPPFLIDSTVKNKSITRVVGRINKVYEEVQEFAQVKEVGEEDEIRLRRAQFQDRHRVIPDKILEENSNLTIWIEGLEHDMLVITDKVYATGFIDQPITAIPSDLIFLRTRDNLSYLVGKEKVLNRSRMPAFIGQHIREMSTEDRLLSQQILLEELKPNYLFSDSLLSLQEVRAVSNISPTYGIVRSGEVIVKKGEKVTPEKALIIDSYKKARENKYVSGNVWVVLLGQFGVILILTALLALFLRTYRPRIYFRNRKLMMVLLLFFVMMLLVVAALRLTVLFREVFDISYIFMVPLCMVPILLAIFFDLRLAFFGNIVMALFVGAVVPNGFEYIFVQVCAGTMAVVSLGKMRKRADFFLPLLSVLATYLVTYFGYNFYVRESIYEIPYSNLILFGINILLTFSAYPVVYLFEKGFKITSDLTYVELLDTNHPLLKELSKKAPGTFQHSIQVANIAEAVINRIGGNALMTKVGALYHDIGKMKNPKFFIENQQGEENPHDKIRNEESVRIIINHVLDGIEMAKEKKLPSEIIDFVQTHHGTARVEYFYRKFLMENPDAEVDANKFCYPGPTPFSKETAVVMIADSTEAACRSLKSPSAEDIETLVNKIIDSKIRQDQFLNTPITFQDLTNIREVVADQLVSVYHGRIEYPDENA